MQTSGNTVKDVRDSALLTVRNVSKRYGGVDALRDVSFDVSSGAIVALIGPNGAGKTTLFDIVTGVETADTGAVLFGGADVTGWPSHMRSQAGMARTFQNLRLFESMTVSENVAAASMGNADSPQHGRFGWLRQLLRTWLRDPARANGTIVSEWLASVGLGERAGDAASELPYAEQRRLEIARALACRPRLLVLDEPVAGMTREENGEVADLVRAISRQGVTVLLIEHNMRFIMSLADWVVVLDKGEKIAEGPPEDVRQDPRVVSAYLGSES